MPGALAQPATLDAGGDATASNRVARVPRVKVVRKREPESNLPSGGFDGPSPGGAARADAVVDDDDDDDDTNANGREGKKAKLPAAAVAVLKEWLLSPEHVDYPYPSDEVGFVDGGVADGGCRGVPVWARGGHQLGSCSVDPQTRMACWSHVKCWLAFRCRCSRVGARDGPRVAALFYV